MILQLNFTQIYRDRAGGTGHWTATQWARLCPAIIKSDVTKFIAAGKQT